jgi:hypothetical protein
VAALLVVVARPTPNAAQALVRDELLRAGGFSAAEVARFETGEVIARLTPGDNQQEVAILAAVRIRSDKESTLSYFSPWNLTTSIH